MKTRSQLMLSAAILAVQPLSFTAAQAQDVDLGSIDLGESRRGVQTDTAASETVITSEEIEARQASTMAELLDSVPNATLVNGGLPQGSGISIRGLGIWAGTYGTDGKVSVVVDGVPSGQEEIYRNGSLLALEPELFKEITVMRGPGESFQYSSGAIGGTVEAVTKDASDFLEGDDTFSFRQKFGYESNGDGVLSTSILAFRPDDRLEVLGFFGYREVDDRTDGDGVVQDATGFKQPSGLLKASYRLDEAQKLTFSYMYNEIPEFDVPYNAYDPNWTDVLVDRDTVDETAYVSYEFAPVGNDLVNLEARLYFKNEAMRISDPTGTSDSGIYNADHDTTTIGYRLENTSNFLTGNARHSLLAGAEVKQRERTSTLLAGADAGENDPSAPGGTDESFAVYLVDTIEVNDRFTLTPQLRYERQKLTSENNGESTTCYGPTYCVTQPAIPDGTSYTAEALTGALSARYAITNEFAVFGTMAYNENLPILDDLRNDFITQSEKGRTYEIGASYDGFDVFTTNDALRAKLTLFHTHIWDGTTYSGIEETDLKGGEFELSYVHPAFYADFNAGVTRGTINDTSDDFKWAPADAMQLTLGKRFMDNQLDLAMEAKYAWAQDRTPDTGTDCATCPTDSYALFGLTAAYRPNAGWAEGVEFRAAVENLFDEEYRPYLSTRNGTGRNIKLSVAKTF